jgi:hypothetical protein
MALLRRGPSYRSACLLRQLLQASAELLHGAARFMSELLHAPPSLPR